MKDRMLISLYYIEFDGNSQKMRMIFNPYLVQQYVIGNAVYLIDVKFKTALEEV
jgi:hypothetical protein